MGVYPLPTRPLHLKVRTCLGAAVLAAALVRCTPTRDDVGPRAAVQPSPLIRDEAHEGRSGFLFLPPLLPDAHRSGTFEARLAPEVRVDKVTAQGTLRSNLATFTASAGRNAPTVLRNPFAEYYVVRWRVVGDIERRERLRVRVLTGGVELGFVDFEVVASAAQADNVDRSVALPLFRGDSLTIKFRIAKHAVDRDADGVFDWLDNCPNVPNPAVQIVPDEVALEPQELPAGCDSGLTACDPNERPANPATFSQLDGDSDGVGDACDCLEAEHCEPAGTGTAGGGGAHPPSAGRGGAAGHDGAAGHAGNAAAAGSGGHDSGGRAGTGAAGRAGAEGAAGDGGHGHGSGDAGAHAAAGAGGVGAMPHGRGPFIDVGAIPQGDRGIATVAIRATRERPADSDGVGAFRTVCAFSHMNFDDPIVAPGRPNSAHLHTYFGNTATDHDSTAQSLRSAGNSTCRGGIANRTAYWVPALIDARGKPLAPGDASLYYKTGYNGIDPKTIQPFPAGLRMIAGDSMASGPQEHAYWGCDHRYIGRSAVVPQCPAGDRIVMTVAFPQCWDGARLDSSDHKSHMAYAELGRCPSSHPVALPEITFNIPYDIPAAGVAGLRLASDTYDPALPPGYSAHADWFEAWDPAVMAAWVRNCDQAALDCHSHLLGDGRELYYSRDLVEGP